MTGALRQVVDFIRIFLKVKEHFHRFGLEKGALSGIELAFRKKLPPLGISEHAVSIVVLKPIWVEGLKATNILDGTFAKGADHLVFLIKTIGMTKGFIPRFEACRGKEFS